MHLPKSKIPKGRMSDHTASPQIGIRPTKQCDAPSARALKISEPRRIPPSIASGIRPCATGAHSLSASRVAGTPSSWRPPWFEMMTPSTPYWMASSTSSGVYTACDVSYIRSVFYLQIKLYVPPFNQIWSLVCFRSQGIVVSQSRLGSF